MNIIQLMEKIHTGDTFNTRDRAGSGLDGFKVDNGGDIHYDHSLTGWSPRRVDLLRTDYFISCPHCGQRIER